MSTCTPDHLDDAARTWSAGDKRQRARAVLYLAGRQRVCRNTAIKRIKQRVCELGLVPLRFPQPGDYGCIRVTAPLCVGREPRQNWGEAVRDGLIKP